MFYTLIKHGFLINHSEHRVLSILSCAIKEKKKKEREGKKRKLKTKS